MLWFFFVFSDLRWEVIVYYIDKGGIVDHHCLNFLLMITYSEIKNDPLLATASLDHIREDIKYTQSDIKGKGRFGY